MSTTMRVRTMLITAFAAIAILIGAAPAPASAASYNASVTIHARLCPVGGPTTDIFTDCHSHPIWSGTKFKINGHSSKTVNASGNITYSGLGAGTRTITQTAGYEPNEFLTVRAYCGVEGAVAVEYPVTSSQGNPNAHFSFNLKAGQHVTCDIYYIPESGQ